MNASKSSPFRGIGGIFLIGFMGSGKSYWGKKWAAINHLSFVDLDELIEKKAGRSIADIFETWGEEHFRKLEAETLRSCAQLEDTIIACGGGTPCFHENMPWMNDHGITIYLSATPTEILQRVLGEQEKRPLIKTLNPEEIVLYTEKKLAERAPFYQQAKLKLPSSLANENTLTEIISTITT